MIKQKYWKKSNLNVNDKAKNKSKSLPLDQIYLKTPSVDSMFPQDECEYS